ncbi:MAG: hypothetical protein WEF50_01805 [Myxococcota bacterium]
MEIRRILVASSLAAVVAAAAGAAADQLVIQLDKTSLIGRAAEGSPALANVDGAPIPRGVPRTLRLPLAVATDGSTSFSLRQESVDGAVETELGSPVMRLRVLSPGLGNVTDDAGGSVSIGMSTTLAFDNLATGQSRVFDISIRGDTRSDAAYGSDIPIYVEAWRRGEDGKPVENPTKENRSFWGTVSGHFER